MLSRTFGRTRVELVIGDITTEQVDAIVNAANSALAPGGGVDGAIRRAAGPAISAQTARLAGCPTGEAKATTAGRLNARWVVHAVGPLYSNRRREDARRLLASAYRRAIEAAAALGAESVAFPAISCGIYGYPAEQAAAVAWRTLAEVLPRFESIRLVRLVQFDEALYQAYERAAPRE